MTNMPELFERNRAWAAAQTSGDPGYFERLCEIQRPDYLWIGCADSRVPANEIVGMAPGELFVHRNVANLVKADDDNCMAAVEYAVAVLGVRSIIVCGHYGCGGVRVALEGGAHGFVETWLAPLRQQALLSEPQLAHITDLDARCDRLCEMNVHEQIRILARTGPVRAAWAAGRQLVLHGWIYSLRDGLLRDLNVSLESAIR